jgi:hypothetical protein
VLIPGIKAAIGFEFRIKMQHRSCDFAPVSTFRIRVEQAQIRDEEVCAAGYPLEAKLLRQSGALSPRSRISGACGKVHSRNFALLSMTASVTQRAHTSKKAEGYS